MEMSDIILEKYSIEIIIFHYLLYLHYLRPGIDPSVIFESKYKTIISRNCIWSRLHYFNHSLYTVSHPILGVSIWCESDRHCKCHPIKIQSFFKNLHLNISSARSRPFFFDPTCLHTLFPPQSQGSQLVSRWQTLMPLRWETCCGKVFKPKLNEVKFQRKRTQSSHVV